MHLFLPCVAPRIQHRDRRFFTKCRLLLSPRPHSAKNAGKHYVFFAPRHKQRKQKNMQCIGVRTPIKNKCLKKILSSDSPPPPPSLIFFAKSELNQHVRFTEKQSQLISALIFPVKLNSAIHCNRAITLGRQWFNSATTEPVKRGTAKVSPT